MASAAEPLKAFVSYFTSFLRSFGNIYFFTFHINSLHFNQTHKVKLIFHFPPVKTIVDFLKKTSARETELLNIKEGIKECHGSLVIDFFRLRLGSFVTSEQDHSSLG